MAGRTDRASRSIAAPPGLVYRAFLEAEAIAKWLPPERMEASVSAFDPRPGSAFRIALAYQDAAGAPGKTTARTDVIDGRFVSLDADERVVWEVEFVSDDPAFAGTMTMTWTLPPVAGGTEVTVLAENVPAGIRREDHEVGLNATLSNLAAYCQGGG